jgi:dTDP-4-dehydrorhamnose 3,5-epimerase
VPEPIARPTTLQDVVIIEPSPVRDERGFFVRTMSSDVLASAGIDSTAFVQENQSRSGRGTLRGLHTRKALSESKMIRCARGGIFEVVVDLRPWSATFEQWESFQLDDVDHHHLFVPAGCAHGFQALTDEVDVCYKHDARYDPSLDAAIAWNDSDLGIPWPISDPVLSQRDREAPTLAEVRPELPRWFGREAPVA